jgi:hypothetical protein
MGVVVKRDGVRISVPASQRIPDHAGALAVILQRVVASRGARRSRGHARRRL